MASMLRRELLQKTISVKEVDAGVKKTPASKAPQDDVSWRRMSVKSPTSPFISGPAWTSTHAMEIPKPTEHVGTSTTSGSGGTAPTLGFTPTIQPPQKGGPPVKRWLVDYRLVRATEEDERFSALSPREIHHQRQMLNSSGSVDDLSNSRQSPRPTGLSKSDPAVEESSEKPESSAPLSNRSADEASEDNQEQAASVSVESDAKSKPEGEPATNAEESDTSAPTSTEPTAESKPPETSETSSSEPVSETQSAEPSSEEPPAAEKEAVESEPPVEQTETQSASTAAEPASPPAKSIEVPPNLGMMLNEFDDEIVSTTYHQYRAAEVNSRPLDASSEDLNANSRVEISSSPSPKKPPILPLGKLAPGLSSEIGGDVAPPPPRFEKQGSMPGSLVAPAAPTAAATPTEGSSGSGRPLAVKRATSMSLMAYQQFRSKQKSNKEKEREKEKEEKKDKDKDSGFFPSLSPRLGLQISPRSKDKDKEKEKEEKEEAADAAAAAGTLGETPLDDSSSGSDIKECASADSTPKVPSRRNTKKDLKLQEKKSKKEKEGKRKMSLKEFARHERRPSRDERKTALPSATLSNSPTDKSPGEERRATQHEESKREEDDVSASQEEPTDPDEEAPPTSHSSTSIDESSAKGKKRDDKKKKKDDKKDKKKDDKKDRKDDKKKKEEETRARKKTVGPGDEESKPSISTSPVTAKAMEIPPRLAELKDKKDGSKKGSSRGARWGWLSNKTKDKAPGGGATVREEKPEPAKEGTKDSTQRYKLHRRQRTLSNDSMHSMELEALARGELTQEKFTELFEVAFASVTLTADTAAQERGLNTLSQLSFEPRFHEEMLRKGLLTYLSPILNSPLEGHQILTASILANFALNEITHSDYRNGGLIPMLGPLLATKNIEFLERLLGFIINLSNNDRNRQVLVKTGILKDLIPLLAHDTEHILCYTARALRNLFYEQDSQVAFCEAGGIKALVESKLLQPEFSLQHEWSILVSLLAWYRPDIRQKLVEAQVLGSVKELLLAAPKPEQLEVLLRTLSYLSVDADLAEQIVSSGAINPVVEFLLQRSTEYLLIELSINILCNLSQKPGVISSLIAESGVLGPILQLLEGQHGRDAILIRVANLVGNLAVDDVARNSLTKHSAMSLLQAQISTPNHKFKESISNAILNLRLCGKAAAMAEAEAADSPEYAARLEKNAKHRASVIKEIIETEKKYVENLLVMVTVFLEPLTKSSNKVISAEDAKGIFSIVEVISNIHTKFLQTLQKRILVGESSGKLALVGDIFLELADSLVVYRDYINNYNNALATLESSLTKSSFRKFLEEEKSNLKMDTLSLSSLLITPIQRIPRYVLMIQDLVDHMPTSSEDYPALTTALRKIIEIGDYLDQEKASAEAISQLYAVQENLIDIDFEIAVSGRSAIREGAILEEAPKKKAESAYLFLFNDILLLARQKGTKYQVRHVFQLCDLVLGDLEPDPKDSSKKYGFKLINFDNEYHIFASSSEEKEAWMKDLEETFKKDEYRWSAEEEAGKESIVRVYLEDCPMFQKLGISNASKALTVTINTSAVEMVKQMLAKIASRSSLSSQILKECATYRIFETNKNGTKGRSFQHSERPARSLYLKPSLRMMFGTPENDKV